MVCRSEILGRTSPVLFPFVGNVSGKQYRTKGKTYDMGQHGFARDMEFVLDTQSGNEIWFVLRSNEETLAKYPYEFVLKLGYRLIDTKVEVLWHVENPSQEELPFAIGGHPAFNCPINEAEKQSDCYLKFDVDGTIVSQTIKIHKVPLLGRLEILSTSVSDGHLECHSRDCCISDKERKGACIIMENEKQKRLLLVVIPLVIAILSFFVVAKFTSSTEFHAKTIQSLDEKKTTVMELTAASTAASAAITLIPGDVGTPIADKLADLSGYFLIVLCAIYLEKYLVTVMGYAAFKILIPLACVFFSVYVAFRKEVWRGLAKKFLLFGLAVYLVIPASVKVSDMIETTYAASIESTIDTAKQATDEIESETGEADTKNDADTSKNGTDDSQKESSGGFLSGLFSKVQEGASTATSNVENVLNYFVEALAILLVTSCLIPILVVIFFIWLVKMVLGQKHGY